MVNSTVSKIKRRKKN